MSSCAAETGLVTMDCLVACCCCPCLVLQITVFLFVRLPKKVVVKSKRIILRRWHKRRAAKRGCTASGMKLVELLDDDFEGAFGIGGECSNGGDDWKERCFAVDDDGMWEALIEQGLFWFGSFWGRPEQGDPAFGEDQMYAGLRLPVVLERVCD